MEITTFTVPFSIASIGISVLHLASSIRDQLYAKIAARYIILLIHALNLACQTLAIVDYYSNRLFKIVDGGEVTSVFRFGMCRVLILVTCLLEITITQQFNILMKKIQRSSAFILTKVMTVLFFVAFLLASIFAAEKKVLDAFSFTLLFFILLQAMWLKIFFKIPKLKHPFPISTKADQSVLSSSNLTIAKKTQIVIRQYEKYRTYLTMNLTASVVNLSFVILIILGYTSVDNYGLTIIGESLVIIGSIILLEVYKMLPVEISVTVQDQITMKEETHKRWTMAPAPASPANESSSSLNRWTLPPQARDDNQGSISPPKHISLVMQNRKSSISHNISPHALKHTSIVIQSKLYSPTSPTVEKHKSVGIQHQGPKLLSPTTPTTPTAENKIPLPNQQRWTLPPNTIDAVVVERGSKMIVPKKRSSFISIAKADRSTPTAENKIPLPNKQGWTLPPNTIDAVVVERGSKMIVPKKRSSFISIAKPDRRSTPTAENKIPLPNQQRWTLPPNTIDAVVVERGSKMIVPQNRSSFISISKPDSNSMMTSHADKRSKLVSFVDPTIIPVKNALAINTGVVLEEQELPMSIPMNLLAQSSPRTSNTPSMVNEIPRREHPLEDNDGRALNSRAARISFLPTSPSLENLFTIVSQSESWDKLYPEADAPSVIIPGEEGDDDGHVKKDENEAETSLPVEKDAQDPTRYDS
jgi:hypothetical protein